MGMIMTCNLHTCSLDKTPCPDSMNLQILNLFHAVCVNLLKTHFCLIIKIDRKMQYKIRIRSFRIGYFISWTSYVQLQRDTEKPMNEEALLDRLLGWHPKKASKPADGIYKAGQKSWGRFPDFLSAIDNKDYRQMPSSRKQSIQHF